jgi:energy-coupling factor transporter transmembrane protein EcfT
MMRSDHLDPLGICLLGALALVEMYLAGVLRWVLRTYALVIPIMMVSLGVSWLIFNPVPGSVVLVDLPVYSGVLSLGVAPWEGGFLLSALLVWRVRHSLLLGLLVGLCVGWITNAILPGPVWDVTSVPLFAPLRLFVSDVAVYTAATKVLGFGVSILFVLGLFMMMRGIEVVGLLNQLHLPFKASFFIALALRSLSTVIEDYDTIRQAQVARGSGFAHKGTVQQIRDFGMMAVPLIATSLTRSTQMAAALAARGFGYARHPTPYRDTRPIRVVDAVVSLGALVFPAVLLASNFNVTGFVGAVGGAL